MPRGARSGGPRRRMRSGGSRCRPSWHRCAGRRGGGCRIAGPRCAAPRCGAPRAGSLAPRGGRAVVSAPRRGLLLGRVAAGNGSGAAPKPSSSSTPVTSAGTVGAGWDARDRSPRRDDASRFRGAGAGAAGGADGVDESTPGRAPAAAAMAAANPAVASTGGTIPDAAELTRSAPKAGAVAAAAPDARAAPAAEAVPAAAPTPVRRRGTHAGDEHREVAVDGRRRSRDGSGATRTGCGCRG